MCNFSKRQSSHSRHGEARRGPAGSRTKVGGRFTAAPPARVRARRRRSEAGAAWQAAAWHVQRARRQRGRSTHRALTQGDSFPLEHGEQRLRALEDLHVGSLRLPDDCAGGESARARRGKGRAMRRETRWPRARAACAQVGGCSAAHFLRNCSRWHTRTGIVLVARGRLARDILVEAAQALRQRRQLLLDARLRVEGKAERQAEQ